MLFFAVFVVIACLIVGAILWVRRAEPRCGEGLGSTPELPLVRPTAVGAVLRKRRKETEPASTAKGAVDLSGFLPKSFVMLDLETTGLSARMHEIIEIGAIRFTLGQTEHATFQIFVKPLARIPKRITSLTGISQSMVDNDGVPLSEALTELIEFIGKTPVVTYNAAFDMAFMWHSAARCGMTFENRYACALKHARKAFPHLDSHKLARVAANLDCPDDNQHRALGDCVRALHVFLAATLALQKKVRWSNSPAGV